MLIVVTYAIYLLVSIALTVWVAQTLFKNGRAFLVDVFAGNESLAGHARAWHGARWPASDPDRSPMPCPIVRGDCGSNGRMRRWPTRPHSDGAHRHGRSS